MEGMLEKTTESIIDYMNDEKARYAIALEGEWGSGKTRYCEMHLANELYKKGYSVLRVSLFGMASLEELYGSLGMALVRLGEKETDSALIRQAKAVASAAARIGLAKAWDAIDGSGVGYEIAPRLLAGSLGKDQLIVLDDAERNSFDGDCGQQELFGAVNDLVEGQGCKVMFVTSSYEKIPSLLREKLVWRCIRFDPLPKDLAESIVLPNVDGHADSLDFDVSTCILEASDLAECNNARAMIRSVELIDMAIKSEAVSDNQVDSNNRARALRDFAMYTFMAANGTAPLKPAEPEPNQKPDTKRIQQLISFGHYSDLGVIADYFDPRKAVGREDVDECIVSYLKKHYAGSPDTMALTRILEKVRSIPAMEDEEAAPLVSELSDCIMSRNFDVAHLIRAIQCNSTLREWGFDETLSHEKVIRRACELVDGDVDYAYRSVHAEYVAWRGAWASPCDELDELDSHIVREFEDRQRALLHESVGDRGMDAGVAAVEAIRKGLTAGSRTHLSFAPKDIAEFFEHGSAAAQDAIKDFANSIEQWGTFMKDEPSRTWLMDLYRALSSIEVESRLGRLRLEWTLEALRKALGILGIPHTQGD